MVFSIDLLGYCDFLLQVLGFDEMQLHTNNMQCTERILQNSISWADVPKI